MAAAHQDAGSATGSGTAPAVTLPAGIQAGDLIVVGLAAAGGTGNATVTHPTGYTIVTGDRIDYFASTTAVLAYRVVDGSEGGASVAWTLSTSRQWSVGYEVIRASAGNVMAVDVTNGSTGSNTATPSHPGVTPAVADPFLVWVLMSSQGNAAGYYSGSPTGVTERVDAGGGNGTTYRQVGIFTEQVTAAANTATGSRSWTQTSTTYVRYAIAAYEVATYPVPQRSYGSPLLRM